MQAQIAPRMLVDKTPDYAMDLEVLRRAEDIFEDPLYIHLARHPLGMIRSYEKGRFILESPFRGRHDFTARQMAELTWLISQRNITEFLRGIPAHRQHRVRFEELVAEAGAGALRGCASGWRSPSRRRCRTRTGGLGADDGWRFTRCRHRWATRIFTGTGD